MATYRFSRACLSLRKCGFETANITVTVVMISDCVHDFQGEVSPHYPLCRACVFVLSEETQAHAVEIATLKAFVKLGKGS